MTKIQEYRDKAKWPVEVLAKRSGVSVRTIAYMESGTYKRRVQDRVRFALATAFGVAPIKLFTSDRRVR